MMKLLSGKSVLFFCPKFFGYDTEIAAKLKFLGAHVDHYDERPKNNFFTKATIRINKKLLKGQIDQYYDSILALTAGKVYDFVFIVNIEAIDAGILSKLRLQQKCAKFILYMWDSLQNKRQTRDLLPYFDSVFSFDKTDANTLPGVGFRPLFFIDRYRELLNGNIKAEIDLCFIGTVHSDRHNLISSIKTQAEDMNLKGFYFMYFPSPVLFFYKKLRDLKFKGAKFREFKFNSLSQQQIVEIINRSSAIIDVQHPGQTGLTMRTLEMLGAGKKLITTNREINSYDFYNEKNIAIIDREKPVLDLSFFNTEYSPVDPDILFKYSIEGWINEIFSENA